MSHTRRQFLAASAGSLAVAVSPLAAGLFAAPAPRKKLAVATTIYHRYSHASHIAGRFLMGYTLNGKLHLPDYEVVSMYVEQIMGADAQPVQGRGGARGPSRADLSRDLAKKYGFRMCKDVRESLTLGGEKLAVDGVLLIGEHGQYPRNDLGQTLYPRYEMMEQTVAEFRASGKSVPVFNDKHLSYTWTKAKQMYDWSKELGFAFQAGSSLPVTFRRPEFELPLESKIESALCAYYGDPEGYGYHLLEALQCHVERRVGGETGIKAVQALQGDDVWKAGEEGRWSKELLDAALSRSHTVDIGDARDNALRPVAYLIEYNDGFKAAALMLNNHIEDCVFAAKIAGQKDPVSTLMLCPWQPGARFFDALVWNIERFLDAGKAVIPVERTLLVSGALEACCQSRLGDSKRIETPYLDVKYKAPADSGYLKGPIDEKGQADGQRERTG